MTVILSGENFQELCDIYIGEQEDFYYNPKITIQIQKQLLVDNIPDNYKNPLIIFVYSHRLDKFINNLKKFKNSFILISHNSDENITEKYLSLIDNPLLVHWFAQNLLIKSNSKISLLPIGFANSIYPHGNIAIIQQNAISVEKSNLLYFNFDVTTNKDKREICREFVEKNGFTWIDSLPFDKYINILKQYKYSICPEGGGIDSHRIWESLSCETIPIMLKNNFSENLSKDYPCLLLDSWEDLTYELLLNNYNENPFTFEIKIKLSFDYFRKKIKDYSYTEGYLLQN